MSFSKKKIENFGKKVTMKDFKEKFLVRFRSIFKEEIENYLKKIF